MAASNAYLFNISICYHQIIFLLLLFVPSPIFSFPLSEFYPYGSSSHDILLEQGDDLSAEVLLSVPVKFFGESYDTIFVNTNGLLSFIYEASYFSNSEFPLQFPVIAPLYSNVDTTGRGRVYYRETNDSSLLQRSTHNVLNLYPNLHQTYEAKSLFIATWDHVGYHEGGVDKVNTFQVVVSTDGQESFVEILYADGGIQWMQATNEQGLPEARAQAGIVAPEGKFYTLRGSGTDQVINLDKWTNTERPGLFMFRIGNINETGNVEAPPNDYGDFNAIHGGPRTCSEGGINCHSNAECYEEPEGYCCRCQPSYFGNGRSCLEREVARRIFGKLKLNINGVSLDLDFHGYIITKDGKIYIAVNNLPESVGYVTQLLFTLDSFVGWLFASPKGNAKNGYMLTGGVANHTAHITFDDYYRVTIKQKYSGLNLFDHIRMEAEIHGTLPDIPRDINVEMPNFNELYTRTGPNEYRSHAEHDIKLGNGQVHTMTVDQTINFIEYCLAAEEDMPTIKMESVKNYINYEKDQSIIRFASFNKIFRGSEKSDDPCIEGKKECVANSSCLVEGDGYRCVCNSGFRQLNNNIYPNLQTDFGCADINECADGTNACHTDAICVNEIGSYYCQCKPGFTGDGKYCESSHEESVPDNAVCTDPSVYSSCTCRQGYQMVGASTAVGFSCEDINECLEYSCPDGADCINLPGNYTCRCKAGYKEDDYGYCYRADPCSLIVCPEDTVCEIRDGTAYCSCPPGYSGTPPNCSPNYAARDCSTVNCPDGSRCINEYEQEPTCVCLSGYGTPPDCETVRTDTCSSDLDCPDYSRCNVQLDRNACICLPGYEWNGLSCVSAAASYETIYRTCLRNTCWCPPGYYESDEICIRHYDSTNDHGTIITTPNPWEDTCNEPCHHNAQCIYVQSEQKYKCMCQAGYEGNGVECHVMDLSCKESADYCHYNATCFHDMKSDRHICICKEGFEGDGTTCYPVADSCEGIYCHPNAQCTYVQEEQQYKCVCRDGFQGNGFDCQSTGFCVQDSDCGPNAYCYHSHDYNGRYDCACNSGYERNAQGVCELDGERIINICSNCHENAVCVERYDSQPECVCTDGYEGDGVDCREKVLGCDILGGCSQHAVCLYSTSVSRYVCHCKEGFEGNGTHCESVITCVEEPDLCSPHATCTYGQDKFFCECNDGFYGNGTFCKEARKQSEEFLLVNKGHTILHVPFNPTKTNRGHPIHINENQTAIGIACDCVEGRVYWSDIINLQVKSSKYDGTDFQVFMDEGIQSPEGLAIDWLNREVYWTDSGNDKIVAVNLDTKEVRTVASENLVNPRGIAVNPYRKKVYWSDWNRDAPKIEWANLDGTGRQIIVQEPSIKLPNSLAIDWSTEELCWADAGTKTIECLNVEANRPRTIVRNCSYPYGLAITDDMYFWTDWYTLKLESSSKDNPNKIKSIELPLGGYEKLYGVVAVTSCP